MSKRESRAPLARIIHRVLALSLIGASVAGAQLVQHSADAAAQSSKNRANWTLANRWTNQAIQQASYSTNAQARFVGETDSAFYSWRDQRGLQWYLVV